MAFTAIPIVLDDPPRLPSGHPSAAARRRLLRDTAARLFAERGVAGTTLHGVARQAGLAPGRLTACYDGKRDLLAEVMHDHLAALGLRVDIAAAAEADAPPEDQLAAMVQALLDGIQANLPAHRVLVQEMPALTEAERRMVRTRYKLLAYAFGDPLVAAVPALRPRPGLAKAMVLSLLGLASTTAFWFRPDGAVNLPTYAQLLVRMVLAGARGLGRRGRRTTTRARGTRGLGQT